MTKIATRIQYPDKNEFNSPPENAFEPIQVKRGLIVLDDIPSYLIYKLEFKAYTKLYNQVILHLYDSISPSTRQLCYDKFFEPDGNFYQLDVPREREYPFRQKSLDVSGQIISEIHYKDWSLETMELGDMDWNSDAASTIKLTFSGGSRQLLY